MSNDLNEHFDLPMISIKRTIEKLFGDEQFERAQHINFVIELLSSQQTDNCLDGLNLDCFDIDVEFQSNLPKPSVISFNKKVKISDLPITSYVNSISQLSESQTHAKNWNILVLKAAIYLIALPELKPELFKQAHTEHFNTVKRLFQRFRTANKNLDTEKKYQNTQEYQRLWSTYLQDPTQSLEQFIQHLITLDTDELPEFDRNLLNDIRITFNYILKNKAKIARASIDSFDDIQQYLRKLRQELLIPKLSVVKVSSLLHHTVLAKTGNKQLADLITGIDANQSSSISYCHQNIPRLHAQYIDILKSLCADIASTYESCVPSPPDSIIHFGSRKAPKPQVITEIFAVLKFNIFSQAEDDLIAIYNHYNIWMWHILLLFTAARPVAEFPGFLKNFNLKRQILMVSDKEAGGRNGFGRLIPLCSFLVEEIKKFLKFLEYFSIQIMMSHPALSDVIQQIEASKLPFLGIIQDDEWKPLSPSTVKNFHPELGLDHANWHRHTARAFLTHKFSEPEILALFGHELMQQEAAHPFSSLSLSQFSKIADVLEQMKTYFKITGVEAHVITQ